ncbi:MAG: hypothetical protein F4175_19865 [Gemmatimonadetes bacterium]|nr:hypothetical protein [Gemmatimonadota bacterium]
MANSDPFSITYANDRFYVLDPSDVKVYAYTSSGQRVEDADFDLAGNNNDPSGITYANDQFYVPDAEDEKVYVYTIAGQRVAIADFDLANTSPSGIAYFDNLFYVVDAADEKVYVYTGAGQRVGAADFDVAISDPRGIVYANDQFYVLEVEGAKVHWYAIADPTPDLIIVSPSASNDSPNTGESFSLSVAVRNQGAGSSAATSLRYYLSTDDSITTSDTEVGTGAIGSLTAGVASNQSIDLNAPSSVGIYYYGACVQSVSGESNTDNNCSNGVRVSTANFALDGENTDPEGIVYANNRFYVVDARDGKVYAYTSAGQRDAAADFTLDSDNSAPATITYANDRFYVADFSTLKVYAYTGSGQSVPVADFYKAHDIIVPFGF